MKRRSMPPTFSNGLGRSVGLVKTQQPFFYQGMASAAPGSFLRDVTNKRNFRVFGPDETVSNLLQAVFEVTDRQWDARAFSNDKCLAPEDRVLDSMLSENQCEGWLKGCLLTGRHGLLN